jgi:hypothetical protein
MDSSELALLLGLVSGGLGGYFGGKRREERERENKKQDTLDAFDLQKQLLEQKMAFEKEMKEKAEAEAEKYDEGGFNLFSDTLDAINPFQRFEYGTPVNPDSNMYIPLPGNPFNDPRQTDTFPYGLDLNPFFNEGGRVGLSEGTDERGVIGRAVDVGADFITRLGRGVVRPEDYDAEDVPGFIKYFNPLDFIGTFNEATGLQRLLMGPDQQADQRVLDILGTPNPNYDPDVVGTGDILDPLLMQMYGFPQDTRGLED